MTTERQPHRKGHRNGNRNGNSNEQRQRQQQIPFGDDNQKGNRHRKGHREGNRKSNSNNSNNRFPSAIADGEGRTLLGEAGLGGVLGDVFCGDVDVEAGEEVGDLGVGEAAFAEEADLVAEHGDYLWTGEALLFGAGGLSEFACRLCDLICGVGGLICHVASFARGVSCPAGKFVAANMVLRTGRP